MNQIDNRQLLREYTERGDEAAFRELVEHYIDLVYSTALRRVCGDAVVAEDVTQAVFTDLARKAPSLRDVEFLGGWLHRHTGFVAANLLRSEQRRKIREQQAVQMNTLQDSPDAVWQQLAPALDETMEHLESSDRQAILLRFFERLDFRSIGAALGISDDAAQKRVSRALEKLRELLAKRGVHLSLAILSALMAGKVVKAAPAGLASKVAGLALAGGAAGTGLSALFSNLGAGFIIKTAIAVVALGAALLLFSRNHSARPVKAARMETPSTSLSAATEPTASASQPKETMAAPVPVSPPGNTNSVANQLMLTIVSADSGKPIPNVEVDYWLWVKGKVQHRKPLKVGATGTCDVPVPDGTTELLLVSEAEGFADTKLDWHANQGEKVPAQYTLRVAPAVMIGGVVQGPDGKPVAGAQVGFNNQVDPSQETQVQSDDFGWPFWITAKTDAQGRWQINRISKAAAHSIYGSASHPDFVQSAMIWPNRYPAAESQLLAGQYVFSLGRAVTVSGSVQDEDGQPIANAEVLVGHQSESGSREKKSQSDGSFSIAGCKPGKNIISAVAKGYAATTMQFEAADTSNPIQLVLHKGKMFKLKVTDVEGNPIAKANVWLDTFENPMADGTSAPPVQVDFNRRTGADGRLEWDSAPDGELHFAVSAAGYMPGNLATRPDGTEQVVKLEHGLTISGSVRNAFTGEPVPKFRIITGWPVWNPRDNSTNAHWSQISRFWMSFEGGKFRHSYDEPVLNGTPNPGFIFKIEAEGYAPFITRVVQASERAVHFDVALTPAAEQTITVLLPNGKPAAATEIGLVSPGAELQLVPGGLGDNSSGGAVIRTDDQGHFQFPADPTLLEIVAANQQGFASAKPSELANQPVIHLQPWGRLRGTFFSRGQPVEGCELAIQYARNGGDAISCGFNTFQATTDKKGSFYFPQAPPGVHVLALITPTTDMGRKAWTSQVLQDVTVRPGETTTVTLGDSNSAQASHREAKLPARTRP